MRKSEIGGLAGLLKECVLEFIEISKQSKIIIAYDREKGFPPTELTVEKGTVVTQLEFGDVYTKFKLTKLFENLSNKLVQNLPSLFKSKVDDIIYTTIHRSLLPKVRPGFSTLNDSAPYWWNEEHFRRALNELMRQFEQPENRIRFIAPIFDFDVERKIQIDKQIIIRKATPYDRYQISDNDSASSYISNDYDCVMEITSDYNLENLFDKEMFFRKFVELGKISIDLVSCLRIFSGSLSHLRFGVFIIQNEGITMLLPGLIEHPELVLTSTSDVHILPNRYAQELAVFWKNYKKGRDHNHFLRANGRYDKAIIDQDYTSKFTDLVLSLEALFKSTMPNVQYLAASLVSHNNEIRRLVFDYLDIVRTQRNKIMHGSSSFGKEYQKKLRKFYGQGRDLEWFITDLTALVRQCLRLSLISDKLDSNNWGSSLIDTLFQKRTNRTLVGITKSWTLKGLPSFF